MPEFQLKTALHSLEIETTTVVRMVEIMAPTTAPTMDLIMDPTMALTMAPIGTKTIGTAQNGKNTQVVVDLKKKSQKKMKVT